MLPGEPAAHGQHQQHRVLGDRDRVGAAVVAYRDLGAARGLYVDTVVAGGEKLHQLEPRGGAVERIVHRDFAGAEQVLRLRQGGGEFGRTGGGGHDFELGGRELVHHVEVGQRIGGDEDARHHGSFLRAVSGIRPGARRKGRAPCAPR